MKKRQGIWDLLTLLVVSFYSVISLAVRNDVNGAVSMGFS